MLTIVAACDGTPAWPSASDATLPIIGLSPAAAVPDVQGTYSLTLRSAADCPATGEQALPSHLRTRKYTATVAQAASRLEVTLSGTTFILENSEYWGVPEIVGNRFQGYLASGQAVFILRGPGPHSDWAWSESPDLYEHTGEDRLVVTGIATTSPGKAITGLLNGAFLAPLGTTTAFCESDHHEFALSR